MLVPSVIPFLLLAAYVLLTSAAISDKNDLLCAHQLPAHLYLNVHKIHQQQLSLQPDLKSAPPELSCAVASMSPSLKLTKIEIMTQDSTHTNSTQLAPDSNDFWSRAPRPASSQGKSLNDGLISGIESLDLATDTGDSEETSIEQQHNNATNVPDEECPRGVDTLDCEDCGGPEQTWETSPNRFHCKGIEEENDRWKDCHCLNWEDARGTCTFDSDLDDTSNDRLTVEEELQDSTNETGNLDETSIEQQLNDVTNAPDDEECRTGADRLDCEDCGGPEQTWETSHDDYHCKSIEAERYRWKDCYCVNWEGYQGPCRFGQDRDEDDFPSLPDLPSPSVDSSDAEGLADEHGDANGEPANDEVLLESTAERAAAVTEEEKR